MTLGERLTEDMKKALKASDKVRLSVIRMVRSSIRNAEIDQHKTLSDEEVIDILNRELKQRRDSLEAFESAGRSDLVDVTKQEIAVLMDYFPQQMSVDELRHIIQSVIDRVGATGKADTGKVMSALIPQVRGKADGKHVNQIVQQLLS